MSPLFAAYRITDRRMRRAFHRGQATALLPMAVIVAVMSVSRHSATPPLWGAIGWIVGAQMVLSGAYHLHTTNDRLSRWGQKLADTSDEWFPFLLFSVQTVNVVTVLIVLWSSLTQLGIAVPAWLNVIGLALMLLVPLYLVVKETVRLWPSPRKEHLAAAVRHLLTLFGALFAAGALAPAFQGSDGGRAGVPTPVLVIWVPALLTAAACLLLLLIRVAALCRRSG